MLRDVEVKYDELSGELAILSDTPGVVGEETTLLVVDAAGDVEVGVEIVASRPEIVTGILRHRLLLRPTARPGGVVHSLDDGSPER